MLPDFLLNNLQLSFVGPEVDLTPRFVKLEVQVESVEESEGRDGDHAAQGEDQAEEDLEQIDEAVEQHAEQVE